MDSYAIYAPTVWARLFHALPHVNLTLHELDNNIATNNDEVYYDVTSIEYIESIGLLASAPVLWLIVILSLFLLYLCTRCCTAAANVKSVDKYADETTTPLTTAGLSMSSSVSKKRYTSSQKSRPIRCCLSFFALVTCASLALAFLGNHVVHESMATVFDATRAISSRLDKIHTLANKFSDVGRRQLQSTLLALTDGPFKRDIREDRTAHFSLMDNAETVRDNTSSAIDVVLNMRANLLTPVQPSGHANIDGTALDTSADMHDASSVHSLAIYVQAFERYRWPASIVIQAIFAFFCLLLFVAAIVHSRCLLMVFSVCALGAICLLYGLASLHLFSAVFIADVCINPAWYTARHLVQVDRYSPDVVQFYLRCRLPPEESLPIAALSEPPHASEIFQSPALIDVRMTASTLPVINPFDVYISKYTRSVGNIEQRISLIYGTALKYYDVADIQPHLDALVQAGKTLRSLSDDLTTAIDCPHTFESYHRALLGLCDSGLFGLILMLFASVVTGVLFTVLVWCNSHTWIYFKRGRNDGHSSSSYSGSGSQYVKMNAQDPVAFYGSNQPISAEIDGGHTSTTLSATNGGPTHPQSVFAVNSGTGPGYGGTLTRHSSRNSGATLAERGSHYGTSMRRPLPTTTGSSVGGTSSVSSILNRSGGIHPPADGGNTMIGQSATLMSSLRRSAKMNPTNSTTGTYGHSSGMHHEAATMNRLQNQGIYQTYKRTSSTLLKPSNGSDHPINASNNDSTAYYKSGGLHSDILAHGPTNRSAVNQTATYYTGSNAHAPTSGNNVAASNSTNVGPSFSQSSQLMANVQQSQVAANNRSKVLTSTGSLGVSLVGTSSSSNGTTGIYGRAAGSRNGQQQQNASGASATMTLGRGPYMSTAGAGSRAGQLGDSGVQMYGRTAGVGPCFPSATSGSSASQFGTMTRSTGPGPGGISRNANYQPSQQVVVPSSAMASGTYY